MEGFAESSRKDKRPWVTYLQAGWQQWGCPSLPVMVKTATSKSRELDWRRLQNNIALRRTWYHHTLSYLIRYGILYFHFILLDHFQLHGPIDVETTALLALSWFNMRYKPPCASVLRYEPRDGLMSGMPDVHDVFGTLHWFHHRRAPPNRQKKS